MKGGHMPRRKKKKNRSSKSYSWSTKAEIEFIRGLDSDLLDRYIYAACRRDNWGTVDKFKVIPFAIARRDDLKGSPLMKRRQRLIEKKRRLQERAERIEQMEIERMRGGYENAP